MQPLTLVLDHLRSAFNVGAIFRTADCVGVGRILACGYTATIMWYLVAAYARGVGYDGTESHSF